MAEHPYPRLIVGYSATDSRIVWAYPRLIVGYSATDSRIVSRFFLCAATDSRIVSRPVATDSRIVRLFTRD